MDGAKGNCLPRTERKAPQLGLWPMFSPAGRNSPINCPRGIYKSKAHYFIHSSLPHSLVPAHRSDLVLFIGGGGSGQRTVIAPGGARRQLMERKKEGGLAAARARHRRGSARRSPSRRKLRL